MKPALNTWGILVVLLLVSGLLAGCGGGSALDPKFQPQVNNAADNFQFQSTAVTHVTQTLNYTWQNTGIAANIDQATTVTGGTAVVAIRDAAGVQVYSAGLQSNGTFQSATGQTGNWTIQVVLSNYSGTLNFRAQKRTP